MVVKEHNFDAAFPSCARGLYHVFPAKEARPDLISKLALQQRRGHASIGVQALDGR